MSFPTEVNGQITDLVKPDEAPAENDSAEASAEEPKESEEGV